MGLQRSKGASARRGTGRRRRQFSLSRVSPPTLQFRWAEAISGEEWPTYKKGMEVLRQAGVPFLLGGGFALAAFTGRWRDTKDIDFYVKPMDKARVVAALTEAGFRDYFARLPYDPKWIYRSVRGDVIVDIIWSMANQRAQVDDLWFKRAAPVRIRGQKLWVVPPEEFMWCKLYILQRDHCDWTDVLNLLYAIGPKLNWAHVLTRLGEDTDLLKALLTLYGFLCPGAARQLPAHLWRQLEMKPPRAPRATLVEQRIRWLDSRAWFAGLLPPERKLEV